MHKISSNNARKDRKLTYLSGYDILIINGAKYVLRGAVMKDIYDLILLSRGGKDTYAIYRNKEEQIKNILKSLRDTPRRALFCLLQHLRLASWSLQCDPGVTV